jgi:Mrp family chromosome partitioning ATPase
VDGTVLVIRARHTRRGAVRQGYETLARSGGKILGVTMNRLKEREYDQYYYRYDSYYGDYYGKDGDGGGNGQAGDEVARQPQVPDGSPASTATLRPSRSGQRRDEAPSVSEQ